jgi:hypothetical protein
MGDPCCTLVPFEWRDLSPASRLVTYRYAVEMAY